MTTTRARLANRHKTCCKTYLEIKVSKPPVQVPSRDDYVRERRGYRVRAEKADAEIALPGPLYTPSEIEALLIMQDLMDQLQPGLLENYIKPLRERLKLLLGNKDLRSEQIRRRIRILHMASRPVRPKFFREVSRATLDRRRLVIRYYTRARDETLKREISPQRLVY